MPEEEMPDRYQKSPLTVRAQGNQYQGVEDTAPYGQVGLTAVDDAEGPTAKETSAAKKSVLGGPGPSQRQGEPSEKTDDINTNSQE